MSDDAWNSEEENTIRAEAARQALERKSNRDSDSYSDDEEDRCPHSDSIEIKSSIVDKILGTAGIVTQLEQESQARIFIINTGGEYGDMNTISFSGTLSERRKAKTLIMKLVRKYVEDESKPVIKIEESEEEEEEEDDDDDGNIVGENLNRGAEELPMVTIDESLENWDNYVNDDPTVKDKRV